MDTVNLIVAGVRISISSIHDIYCVAGTEARHGSAVSAAVWDGENAGPIQGTGIPQRSAHGEWNNPTLCPRWV